MLVLAGLAWLGPHERLALVGALGRFHPGFVHLPIGALVVAAVLIGLARAGWLPAARAALVPVLAVAAAGAAAAVAAGQALAVDGTYGGDTFEWHRRLGYALTLVAVGATVAAVQAMRATTERGAATARTLTDVTVVLGVVVLTVTGHLGGTLTHGEGYLTERLPAPFNAWFGHAVEAGTRGRVQPREVQVYEALVAPILADHCVDCHGPSKANGELRLDTPEHIKTGGRTGPTLVAGQAAASDLVTRLWLPTSHADVMPPRGRPPMPAADASVIRWWVDQGASFDGSLADVELIAEVTPSIQARVGDLALDGPTLLAIDPGPLDTSTLTALASQGVPVSRLAADVTWLQVEARGRGRAFGDAEVEALLPLAAHVTWMDLGGTAITDAGARTLAQFPHVTRLHLDRTAITDAGLAAVAGLTHLESLNVYGTGVTDEGLAALDALDALRTLYVAGTAVTDTGVQAATAGRPELAIYGNTVTTPTTPSPPAGGRATRPAPAR